MKMILALALLMVCGIVILLFGGIIYIFSPILFHELIDLYMKFVEKLKTDWKQDDINASYDAIIPSYQIKRD